MTPRDAKVLKLLVQGCSNQEIARQRKISPRTVKQHLRTRFLGEAKFAKAVSETDK
jgi:DNA-binding NarL/FixJ family response regulator